MRRYYLTLNTYKVKILRQTLCFERYSIIGILTITMRKLLSIVLILVFGASAGAQSINLMNLTNLAGLGNKQAADDIAAHKLFKLQSGEQNGEFLIETYKTAATRNKIEAIIIGRGYKLASGGVLHTVSYVSANPQDVINLMGQIGSINVKQSFHGSDKSDNIYIYDSFLYRMTVRLSFDGSRSSVEISQKQAFSE